MAKHELQLHLPGVKIDGRDASITIKKDDEVLGTVYFSKGSLEYYPKKRKTRAISVTWSDFDAIMRRFEAGEL